MLDNNCLIYSVCFNEPKPEKHTGLEAEIKENKLEHLINPDIDEDIIWRFDYKIHPIQTMSYCTSISMYWIKNGLFHRDNNKPAIVDKLGSNLYYKNGLRHRTTGPAVIVQQYNDGYPRYPYYEYQWWENGFKLKAVTPQNTTYYKVIDGRSVCHRDHGPAIKEKHRSTWMKNGMRHRENAPAVVYSNGADYEWYYNDVLHCKTGPALKRKDWEEWQQHGKLHRIGGPAYITPNRQEWYQNGKLHRSDGPAIICSIGQQEWWYRGVRMNKY